MFGTAGLPHILMKFFDAVLDAQAAGKSVFYATGLIGYFYSSPSSSASVGSPC